MFRPPTITGLILALALTACSPETVMAPPPPAPPPPAPLPAVGTIRIAIAAAGEDVDPRGFPVAGTGPGGGFGFRVTAAAPIHVTRPVGTHTVWISDLGTNCANQSAREVTVEVAAGTETAVGFDVSCIRLRGFAATAFDSRLQLLTENIAAAAELGSGTDVSWAPAGDRFAFRRCEYWYYWYYGECYPADVAVRGLFEAGPVRVISGPGGTPAWHPDGSFIAVIRDSRILRVSPDGTSETLLAAVPAGALATPVWSPDGSTLLFGCQVGLAVEWSLCSVREDGSDFNVRLSGPASYRNPAWYPDGSRIAFATSAFGGSSIATMPWPAGPVTRVADGTLAAWSPDGSLFVTVRPGVLQIDHVDGGEPSLMIQGSWGLGTLAWRP